jgi:acyl-CoA thioesterase-2
MSAPERPWSRPLTEVLELTRLGEDRFEAATDGFGGVTLGCALLAAAQSAPVPLHSFHAYFLRAVPGDRPTELAVERLRDGRRFSHRRVQVRDGERLTCELVASFAASAEGLEAQDVSLSRGTPQPESLPDEAEIARREGFDLDESSPFGGPLEWRWVGDTPWSADTPQADSAYGAWVRPRFPLPEERPWHAAALAFLADFHSHMSVARWLGGSTEGQLYTSLDQSLWLHRDLPWNDWWHLTTEGVVAHGGRALTRRSLHSRDGRLVATMAQEQLIPPG